MPVADSFVERKLTERVKSARTTLKKLKDQKEASVQETQVAEQTFQRLVDEVQTQDVELRKVVHANLQLALRLEIIDPSVLKSTISACIGLGYEKYAVSPHVIRSMHTTENG